MARSTVDPTKAIDVWIANEVTCFGYRLGKIVAVGDRHENGRWRVRIWQRVEDVNGFRDFNNIALSTNGVRRFANDVLTGAILERVPKMK